MHLFHLTPSAEVLLQVLSTAVEAAIPASSIIVELNC
jgi:hypothetical protein